MATPQWAFQRAITSITNPDKTIFFGDATDVPKEWSILLQYNLDLLFVPVGYRGVNYSITGKIFGVSDIRFDIFGIQGQSIIPFFGVLATVLASRVEVNLVLQGGAIPSTVQVVGIPHSEANNDSKTSLVDAGIFDLIPFFAVVVGASPAFQTLEVLDAFFGVVQTIVLGDLSDFAPIDPRGVFIRNTAAIDTYMIFKRKALI